MNLSDAKPSVAPKRITPPLGKDTQPATAEARKSNRAEDKWGKEVIAVGFTVVPAALMRGLTRLHIGAQDFSVLMQLLDHWWEESKMPFPSKRELGERLGMSPKSIQRALKRLEIEKLISPEKRFASTGGQTSNRYDISPLVARLKPIAEEMMAEKSEGRKKVKAAGRPGYRPRKNPQSAGVA